jgi:hypothetical protein
VESIEPAMTFSYTLAGTVDASGRLPDGRRFNDIHELKKLLAADPRQLARNLLHQFTLYATGTPVRFSDRDEIEAIREARLREGINTVFATCSLHSRRQNSSVRKDADSAMKNSPTIITRRAVLRELASPSPCRHSKPARRRTLRRIDLHATAVIVNNIGVLVGSSHSDHRGA